MASGLRLRRLCPPVGLKDCLDRLLKQLRDAKGQRQAWIVFACFEGIDCLARDVQAMCQLRLRPSVFGAQLAQTVFHWYLRLATAVPSPHSRIMAGKIHTHEMC